MIPLHSYSSIFVTALLSIWTMEWQRCKQHTSFMRTMKLNVVKLKSVTLGMLSSGCRHAAFKFLAKNNSHGCLTSLPSILIISALNDYWYEQKGRYVMALYIRILLLLLLNFSFNMLCSS